MSKRHPRSCCAPWLRPVGVEPADPRAGRLRRKRPGDGDTVQVSPETVKANENMENFMKTQKAQKKAR